MAQEKPYSFKDDDEKKTALLIGILLVLIFVVGSALIYIITHKGGGVQNVEPPKANQTSKPHAQNLTNITNITNATYQCDDTCLLERAVRDKNLSECQQILAEAIRQECYGQLSNYSLDACKALSDVIKRKSCVTMFAIANKDIMLCDLLVQGKDECMLAVDPCYNATENAEKALCNALQSSNPSLCGSDSMCLLNYSFIKKNSSSCSLIQNAVVSTACISAVGYTDKCSDLPKGAEQDYCYELFAVYTDDYLTCTQITPNSVYALNCYSFFAATLHNLSICDRDDLGLNEKWSCYTNYSLNTGDLSGCEKIHKLATTSRFWCAFEYAKKYGNPAACEIISELGSRSTCYQGAIIYSNQNLDWQYCDDITNFNWMNKCYTESAKLYNDVSICERISDYYSRESCKSSYATNKSNSS